MKSNPFMDRKKENLQKVYDLMTRTSPINIKKLVAIVELQTGARTNTARKYVDVHINTGSFKLEDFEVKKNEVVKDGVEQRGVRTDREPIRIEKAESIRAETQRTAKRDITG